MSKPYQHHDPVLDKGKAVPKPTRPTTSSYVPRWRRHFHSPSKVKGRDFCKGCDKFIEKLGGTWYTVSA